MASVQLGSRSPFYQASFNGPDGERMQLSTMVRVDHGNKIKAAAVCSDLEKASKLAKKDELTKPMAREMIAGIIERIGAEDQRHAQRVEAHFVRVLNNLMRRAGHGENLSSISIESHFREWLEAKSIGIEDSSSTTYLGTVDRFLKHLGKKRNRPLTALSDRDVQRFINKRAKENLSYSTLRQTLTIIKGALNFARKRGQILSNPADVVELPKACGVEREAFTTMEARLLLDAAEGEWKTMIMLAYFTGARLSDCARMEWENIDLVAKTLTHIAKKTGKKMIQPIHGELIKHLNGLAGIDTAEKYIMPGMVRATSGGRHGLSESFKLIMRKAGVSAHEVEGVGVRKQSKRSFHSLRHSFASVMANEGVPEETRMQLIGHTTKAVHRGYTHLELETLANAMNKLPGLK